jgi:hypothetical protein
MLTGINGRMAAAAVNGRVTYGMGDDSIGDVSVDECASDSC